MQASDAGTSSADNESGKPAASRPLAPPIVWTIAGHDPSSGAGITADLSTFTAFGLVGASVVTALTAQSTLGVAAIEPVSSAFLTRALDHLQADLPPRGIKIGIIGSLAAAQRVTQFLQQTLSQVQGNSKILIILDPVIRSSSGRDLLSKRALTAIRRDLLPLVTWITPNRQELAALAARPVVTELDVRQASDQLAALHPHLTIVTTGGDESEAIDILRLPDGSFHRFVASHIESRSTHGTGCVFSSALLCGLVQGSDPLQAVAAAKRFVEHGIRTAHPVGHGRGPLNLTGRQARWQIAATKSRSSKNHRESKQ